MSGGYALVDCNVYTLGDIAKVTEVCFIECYGTNFMCLPPQNVETRKAWADYEDEEGEAPRIPFEDLNSPEKDSGLKLCIRAGRIHRPAPHLLC
eukprot:5459305-Prymnesium_polylepis.1